MRIHVISRAIILSLLAGAAFAQAPQPDGGGLRPGRLPQRWITGGPNCLEVPAWQVHEYNPDLVILRESGCVNYEKPFLYLLFGQDKVLLLDTGAGNTDVAHEVASVIHDWLRRSGRSSITLAVGHSHSHGDHIAGDGQFRAWNDAAIRVETIPLTVAGSSGAFGMAKWPDDMGRLDLGGRVLDVVAIPGHDKLSFAYYDRQTGILFTGDSLYPGRLYVEDFPAFAASIHRLAAFAQGKRIAHLLGCHIEESSTPFLDYPIGSFYQPHEHSLELPPADLLELDQALAAMHGAPVREAMRDYTIYPTSAEVWKQLDAVRQATEAKLRATMWSQPE